MLNAIGYGNAKRGKSGTEDFHFSNATWYDNIDSVSFYRPFFRTIEGHDHTMFVFDVDTEVSKEITALYTDEEVRELKLRAVLEEFDDPYWRDNFLTYISGQGLYLVQQLDKVVNKTVFESVVYGREDSLIKLCTRGGNHSISLDCDGWHNRTQELVKYRMIQGHMVTLKIDKRMVNHTGGRLFRGIYSPYFKIIGSTFYCVPLIWDGNHIDIDATLESSKRENFRNPQPIHVPKFKYERMIEEEIAESIKNPIVRNSRTFTPMNEIGNYSINVPNPHDELTDEQKNLLDEIYTLVTSDETITPPCVKNSFEQKYSRFWSRVHLVRWLAHQGYTPEEVALFIRFRLNDAEDNRTENQHKLLKYTRIAYGDPYDPLPVTGCEKLQDENHEHYSCSIEDRLKCKRKHPLQDYPVHLNVINNAIEEKGGIDQWAKDEETVVMTDKDADEMKRQFESINNLVTDMLKDNRNFEIIKTTRAGVTTSLIYNTAITGKRMLVISPTNRIGEETFPQAMKLAHQIYGVDITGAILSSNTKSCLKLRFEIKDLEHRKKEEPEWGDYGVKYRDLAFHFKPSCISKKKDDSLVFCEYYQNRFPQPYKSDEGIPLPVTQSNITDYDFDMGVREGLCSYTSVVNELPHYDILFITYDKLNAILMNDNSDDAELIRNTLLSDFDVIFMDEISQLAQHSPLSYTIYTKDEETGEIHNSYFEDLYQEYDRLVTKTPSETVQLMGEYIDTFVEYFEREINRLFVLTDENENVSFSHRHDNPINDERLERYDEMFPGFYTTIENYAKDENIHLSTLEKTLLLLKSRFWWLTNVPTNELTINVSFTSSPKIVNIRNFIKDFDSLHNKQVLVTDATMPLIKMSDLLSVNFERFVIGDPRGTCDHQLVISDTKNISSRHLLAGMKSRQFRRLLAFINEVTGYFDNDDILLVLPNSGKIFKNVREAIRKRKIPRVQTTYFRSDLTVGVSSEKRVMIAVCPPFPPKGSYLWLAEYYHEWRLFRDMTRDELSHALEEMNAYQTFYQTIGRVKSPDNTVRSVVFAWGMNAITVDTLMSMDKDVPIPRITSVEHRGADLKYIPIIGKFWKRFGVITRPEMIQLMEYLKSNTGKKFTIKKLISIVFRRMNSRMKQEMENHVATIDETVLEKYNIYTHKSPNGKIYILSK